MKQYVVTTRTVVNMPERGTPAFDVLQNAFLDGLELDPEISDGGDFEVLVSYSDEDWYRALAAFLTDPDMHEDLRDVISYDLSQSGDPDFTHLLVSYEEHIEEYHGE